MLTKNPPDYPAGVPYPLLDYGQQPHDGLRFSKRMSSGRSRNGVKSSDKSTNITLSWNMNQDEYALFMEFWRTGIRHGDFAFTMSLLDGRMAHKKVVQISGDSLSATHSGGRWAISAEAQTVEVGAYLDLPIVTAYVAESAGHITTSPDRDNKLVKVYLKIPNGAGGSLPALTDEIIPKAGGGFEYSGSPSTSTSSDVRYRSNKSVVVYSTVPQDSSFTASWVAYRRHQQTVFGSEQIIDTVAEHITTTWIAETTLG